MEDLVNVWRKHANTLEDQVEAHLDRMSVFIGSIENIESILKVAIN